MPYIPIIRISHIKGRMTISQYKELIDICWHHLLAKLELGSSIFSSLFFCGAILSSFNGQLGVPLTVYPWYLLCSRMGFLEIIAHKYSLSNSPESYKVGPKTSYKWSLLTTESRAYLTVQNRWLADTKR